MGVFVDTNIFFSFVNLRDRDHERAVQLVDELRKGRYGIPYTSDYILDEAVTVALMRTRRLKVAIDTGTIILGSKERGILPAARMLMIDEKTFQEAWKTFASGKMPQLSFTDQTSLSLSKGYTGGSIMSFDQGFDGLLVRVH